MTPPQVRTLTRAEHLDYIAGRPEVSFLQTPAWGQVKREWRSESVGWVVDGAVRGAALVLYRAIPRMRRSLAYLPEGPDLPWAQLLAEGSLPAWLDALREHLRQQGAFAIRIGPMVVTRRWNAATLKAALAAEEAARLGDLPPDDEDADATSLVTALTHHGWQPPADSDDGFAIGQPRHVFWLPLAGRSEDQVFASFNQLWRRNVRRAEKVGVQVRRGTADDLPAFHTLYVETAKRDGFTPRPLSYFEQMWDAMRAEAPERIELYLAEHEGDLVAATTMTRVGGHAWYSYGASSTHKREVRGSNAVQWQMIRDALGAGAHVYDLRGITDTLAADDPHVGLLQFKVGTGGEAVEYVGEWTLPVNKALTKAFELVMARRG